MRNIRNNFYYQGECKNKMTFLLKQMRVAAIAGGVAAGISLPSHATVINTADPATMGAFYSLGEDTSFSFQTFQQFGQTFTAPALNSRLDSFSFYLTEGFAPVNFSAAIYQWNGMSTTGSMLFTSTPRFFDGSLANPATGFQRFDFATGGLNLVSGNRYVAVLSATLNNSLQNAGWGMAYDASMCCQGVYLDAYTGGELVLRIDQQSSWRHYLEWDPAATDGTNGIDTAFQLNFSNVATGSGTQLPLPSSSSLLAAGVVAALILRRQVRKKQEVNL
ncbi:MAG: hypothetical protein JF616_00030 [Fibrobacteres bacterium]|nr:hypothetical protein [Fibrobacterota bacterium]